MKGSRLRLVTCAMLAVCAKAEIQIDVSADQLGGYWDWSTISSTACFSLPTGESHGCLPPAYVSEGGWPHSTLHFIWSEDQGIPAGYIDSISFSFTCEGLEHAYTLGFEPFELPFIHGPANPPAAPMDFGFDTPESFVVNDLRLSLSGPDLVLDWDPVCGADSYLLYALDSPWQSLQDAEVPQSVDAVPVRLRFAGGARTFYRVVTVYHPWGSRAGD